MTKIFNNNQRKSSSANIRSKKDGCGADVPDAIFNCHHTRSQLIFRRRIRSYMYMLQESLAKTDYLTTSHSVLFTSAAQLSHLKTTLKCLRTKKTEKTNAKRKAK